MPNKVVIEPLEEDIIRVVIPSPSLPPLSGTFDSLHGMHIYMMSLVLDEAAFILLSTDML